MFIKTKLVSILMILTMVLLIAAQCGAQPERQEGAQSVRASEATANEAAAQMGDEHEPATVFEALAPVSLGEGEKLKVVATINIIGDLVKNVGGDRVELMVMLPAGSDPHTFSPTPQDAAAVADAHVIFINGLNLEEFLNELIDNAGSKAAVIPVSAGVETREFGEGEAHAHEEEEHEHEEEAGDEEHEEKEHEEEAGDKEHEEAQEHEEAESGHHHEGADPHIWTTPVNAMVMVHNIAQALSALDPANAETYQANAEAYEAQLEELDAWMTAQVETIPVENRKLVTDHETFGYYANRYGFEVIGAVIPGSSTGVEPSAQALAELQKAVSEQGVKAVFVGTTVSPALAQRLSEDTGIRLVPLYSDSLGAPGSEAETYLDYLRYNTHAIVEALK